MKIMTPMGCLARLGVIFPRGLVGGAYPCGCFKMMKWQKKGGGTWRCGVGGNAGNRSGGCPRHPRTQHWNISTIPLCNNIPRNTPYGSSYVHGKMSTNDTIKKIER